MATKSVVAPLRKIIVIVGTTGVGKTRLSIELAKRFNGEIVNSDAMQMYNHLDIGTAKVTEEEKCGIPHHLMSFLEPTEQYTAVQYQAAARAAIEDISKRGKLPVVVGGTMFYVQALLWNSIFDQDTANTDIPQNDTTRKRKRTDFRPPAHSLSEREKQDKWEELRRVDPLSANRIHPNNVVRVLRSLEVFHRTGRPHSEIIAEHRQQDDAKTLQYDAHMIWLRCQTEVLQERLNKRVDDMRHNGLVAEVHDLWNKIRSDSSIAADRITQLGVLKSIGFKEFAEYFTKRDQLSSSPSPVETKAVDAVLEECFEALKLSTRQYARKQIRWIRNRFEARGVTLYPYNTDDVALWNTNVRDPAIQDVQSWLDGLATSTNSQQAIASAKAEAQFWESRDLTTWKRRHCHICDRMVDGQDAWEAHIQSRRHNKLKRFLTVELHPLDVRGRERQQKLQQRVEETNSKQSTSADTTSTAE